MEISSKMFDRVADFSILPDNEKDISYCQIDVIFNNGKVTVTPYNPTGSCPREY